MSATRMIFRTVKRGGFKGSVDAIIIDAEANPGRVVCYSHIGQHSEGVMQYFREQTRDAKREERLPLLRELQGIYGPIRVMRRMPARRGT